FSLSYTSPLDASSMTARTLVILCAVLVAGWFAAAQAAARDRSRRSPRTSRAARPHKRKAPVGTFRSAASALRWYGWTHNRIPFAVALGFVAIPCLPGVIGAAVGNLNADEAE